jgi:hypothetical protein
MRETLKLAMIFSEVGLLGLNSIFGSKKAPFFSIVDSWEGR